MKSNIHNIFHSDPKYFGFYVKQCSTDSEWCFAVLIFAQKFTPNNSGKNLMKDHAEKVEEDRELRQMTIAEMENSKTERNEIAEFDRTHIYLQAAGWLVGFRLYFGICIFLGLF